MVLHKDRRHPSKLFFILKIPNRAIRGFIYTIIINDCAIFCNFIEVDDDSEVTRKRTVSDETMLNILSEKLVKTI